MESAPGTALRRGRRKLKVSDVIEVCRRLDASCAKRLIRSMNRLVDAGGRRCVIDMSSVETLDSAGFGSLMAAVRKMEQVGGSLAVVCGNPTVQRLFEIAGITRLVPVVPTIEEARDIMSKPGAGSALAS